VCHLQAVAVKAVGPPVWEPGNNRRVVVPRPGGSLPAGPGSEVDLVLGLLQGVEGGSVDEEQPDAQLVETSGGNTMVKLTTTYTASFGEYLKVRLLQGRLMLHWESVCLLVLFVLMCAAELCLSLVCVAGLLG
jgi:hypothetical protein